MNTQKTGTLADKIAGILNTTPSNFDPEEAPDETTAPTTFEETENNDEEEEILSKFRKQNIDLLADIDEKYAGKKASRKSLRESSDEDDSVIEEESDLEEDENDEDDDAESAEDDESAEEESDGDEEENEESDDDEEGIEESDSEDIDPNFKHIKETNVSNEIKKGTCVRNQMAMWENLLEVRIQLQKCLLTANKMPQNDKFCEIKQESGPDFSNKLSETKSTLCGVLDKLLNLQALVLKKYPETKDFHKEDKDKSEIEDDDNEEIPSDTDIEESELEEGTEMTKSQPKKRKLPEYEEEISKHHKKYKDYRNKIIQKWNDKTRVVLKGGATSHSVLDQIEYNLSNGDKLIKKTQLRRSQYTILGEEEGTGENNSGEEYNTEIYDDDDFYHQLLRELIEVKSADVTDPVQLGRQWIQLQNLRSKMKRKIDTRATKGRKIRYAIHNKLVNFMAPIDQEFWTDEAKTELFNSLFGKNQPVFNV